MGDDKGAKGSPDCAGVIEGMLKLLVRKPPGWGPAGAGVSPDTDACAPGHPLPGDGVAILVRPDMGVADNGAGEATGFAA
jgi:hypothetical protein